MAFLESKSVGHLSPFVSSVIQSIISSPAQAPADRFGSVFVRKGKPLAGHGEIYTIHGGPG